MTPRGRRRRHAIHVHREAGSNRWIVATAGRRRSRHRRQATAAGAARRLAKRRHVDVVTHGRNGRFRAKHSYGNETRRPDGTR